jgi:hypothetical protein
MKQEPDLKQGVTLRCPGASARTTQLNPKVVRRKKGPRRFGGDPLPSLLALYENTSPKLALRPRFRYAPLSSGLDDCSQNPQRARDRRHSNHRPRSSLAHPKFDHHPRPLLRPMGHGRFAPWRTLPARTAWVPPSPMPAFMPCSPSSALRARTTWMRRITAQSIGQVTRSLVAASRHRPPQDCPQALETHPDGRAAH